MARTLQAVVWIPCWLTCGVFFLSLVSQGVSGNFVFLKPPLRFATVAFADNFPIDCSTNGTNATSELIKEHSGKWVSLPSSLLAIQIRKKGDVFTILDFGLSDSGNYKCRATDGAGQTIEWPNRAFLIPDINKMPSMTVGPEGSVVIVQGGSTNFTCESIPQTSLIWYKMVPGQNDVPVPADKIITNETGTEKIVILAIKNGQMSDSSSYKCVLSFRSKKKYEFVTLKVLEIKLPQIVSHTQSLTTRNLKDIKLECNITGFPQPLMKWYKGDKEITVPGCSLSQYKQICQDEKYLIQNDTIKMYEKYKVSLKIFKGMYPDDQETYHCKAGSATADININIQAKPKLNQRVNKLVVQQENSAKQIACNIEASNPKPTWIWKFQKYFCSPPAPCNPDPSKWKPVDKSHTIVPVPGIPANKSVITIPQEQQGQTFYQCIAENSLDSDNLTFRFLRSEAQVVVKIKNSKSTLTYTAGIGPITIECDLFKQFTAFGILWFRGKSLIYPDSRPRISVTKINSSHISYDRFVFSLTNTTVNDTGTYTCSTVTDRNENDTINVVVKARIKPNITGLASQDLKQETTSFVELKCETSNANPPAAITWYRDGDEISGEIKRGLDNTEGCKERKTGYYFLIKKDGSPLIICNPEHPKYTGKYKCTAKNIEGSDTKSAKINILAAARIVNPASDERKKVKLESSLNVTCEAKGNPTPTVVWTRTGKTEILKSGKGLARLQFSKFLEKDLGNYTCRATNYKSHALFFSFTESNPNIETQTGSKISQQALVGIICGCIAFVLLVSIICFIVYRRQKKQIEEYKELYFLRTGNSDYKIDPDRSLLDQCNDLPYDLDWEFPEERLILGKPLGAGAFGQVVKAEAIGMAAFKPRDKTPEAVKNRTKLRRSMRESKKKNEYSSMRLTKTTVAVKTLKEGATQSDYKDLASELKILIHLGNHKNIVNVLGACTRGRRLMVIIEFAPHGDLLSFLRGKRDIYEPNWAKTSNNPDQEFTLVDLAMAAYQISRGMEFLASRKCVHRDLAARNVLVGKDFIMKISDFGLARDIYKDDLYVKTTSGLLPVKWMAMESLFDRVYTEKSDVWSYGIVLWEIFTLGGNPYPGLPTEQLLDYLSEGQRMKQPQNCPLEIYAIMRDCWMQFPEQRPEFTVIAERLGNILERNVSEDNPYIYLEMDEQTGVTDYYLNPCDAFNTQGRQTADGYEEALPTPRPDTSNKYDSPLPSLPPDSPGYDGPTEPLPSIPPTYEEATKRLLQDEARKPSESSNESGIGIDEKEKGRYENEPLIVRVEDETRVSPKKGRGRSAQESAV